MNEEQVLWDFVKFGTFREWRHSTCSVTFPWVELRFNTLYPSDTVESDILTEVSADVPVPKIFWLWSWQVARSSISHWIRCLHTHMSKGCNAKGLFIQANQQQQTHC